MSQSTAIPITLLRRQALRYAYLCHLNRPADLALLLLPGLWASLLAAEGSAHWGYVTTLLIAATLIRCAAWVFNDWMDARLLTEAPAPDMISVKEVKWLLGLLIAAALILLLFLPTEILYYAAPVPLLLAAIPFVKTRTFMLQPYLGLCYAWLVPMAYAAQDVTPGKAAWLLFTATLLWASAFTTLHALPRRNNDQQQGIRSLAQLFDNNSWVFIMAMQLSAIFSLWLAGSQMQLGIFFSLGIVVTFLLLPYQLWLLFSHPQKGAMRSYHNQIWSGIAVLCGIGFHYICVC